MFCSNCGVEIKDQSKFCSSCGSKITLSTVPPLGVDFDKIISDQNPFWLRSALTEILPSVVIECKNSLNVRFNINKSAYEVCMLSEGEFLCLIFLEASEVAGRESVEIGEKIAELGTQRLLDYLNDSINEAHHAKLLDSVFNIVVYVNGRQVFSTDWAEGEDEDEDEDEDESGGDSQLVAKSSIDVSILESYANRITEKNLLSDLISDVMYDIDLNLENYESNNYKLTINIGSDDEINLDEDQKEQVGDIIFDYLRERGAFDDVGVDAGCVDWIVVTIGEGCVVFEELMETLIAEYKKSPRNKVFVDEKILLASVEEETGSEVDKERLRDVISKYIDGDLDQEEESIYDAAVYACGVAARTCFGSDPEESVDHEISWIKNNDGSFSAEVRLS